MSGYQFDQIAQELLKQKQRMDKLQAENRNLRQQIADLRSGRGIFVDIHGSRFALRDDASPAQTNSASAVSSTTAPSASTTTTSTPPAPSTTQPPHQHIEDKPTAAMAEITPQVTNNAGKKSANGESTFLEEIMIDEFNSVLASPSATWQDPAEKQQSPQQPKSQDQINEERKAALRRELMGSFLLE